MRLTSLALILLVGLASGCSRSVKDDPILRLSSQEALAEGKLLLEQKKWVKARKYLTHAFEAEPNSASGREGLLLVADAFFLDGGIQNYIRAEAKYRDFLNRFPTSEKAAYVQYQIGNSLFERIGRPDRDQSITRDAVEAFEDVLVLYADSEYAALARERLGELEDKLAEHEFVVGFFYHRYGLPRAAAGRLEYLLENYPGYTQKEKVLYYLGMSYARMGRNEEAEAQFQELRSTYPDSRFLSKLPEIQEPAEE
jgi:outer membrane protein assembly factor BamD